MAEIHVQPNSFIEVKIFTNPRDQKSHANGSSAAGAKGEIPCMKQPSPTSRSMLACCRLPFPSALPGGPQLLTQWYPSLYGERQQPNKAGGRTQIA